MSTLNCKCFGGAGPLLVSGAGPPQERGPRPGPTLPPPKSAPVSHFYVRRHIFLIFHLSIYFLF